jgi:hypothetical protein
MARIKMAWAEAGILWSAPNFDILTPESPGGRERLTWRQIPPAGSHFQSSLTSIMGSFHVPSSSAMVVPHLWGHQDPNARAPSSTVHQVSYFHAFPLEIIMEVLGHISLSDLRSFALSNALSNDLAGRRLWRKFVISGNSIEEVAERCTALLRLPSRANRVISLVVGPSQWAWTSQLLHLFQHIWPAIPRLADLALRNSHSGLRRDCAARLGSDPEPIIRGLLPHARSFCLRSFEYEGWLWPESPLHMFLCAQPSIKVLFGVDIFTTRPLSYSPRFLPSLEILGCQRLATALHFAPNRPIRTLSVSDHIFHDSDLTLLNEALETCKGALTELNLSVFQWPPPDQIGHFAKILREVRMLTLRGYSDFASPFPFLLPALEELQCLQVMHEYEADPVRMGDFASQFGPKLRRIFVYARGDCHTWLKEARTEYIATFSCATIQLTDVSF